MHRQEIAAKVEPWATRYTSSVRREFPAGESVVELEVGDLRGGMVMEPPYRRKKGRASIVLSRRNSVRPRSSRVKGSAQAGGALGS